MGLKEQMEEDRKALQEALEAEGGAKTDEVVDEPTSEEETPTEPEKAEEPAKEEPKEEPKAEAKTEEEPKLDDSGYRRLRREKQAAEKEAKELREKIAALEAVKEDPKPKENYQEAVLQEVIQDHAVRSAQRGFEIAESEFMRRTPEYQSVAAQYWGAMAASVKLHNPRMSDIQVQEATKNAILNIAEGHAQKGLNPAEEMYHDALELGFKAKKEAPVQEEELKPDLNKVAANRARNAGMAAAKGRGASAVMTKQYAATELTTQEWVKLPKAERERLMYGAD